MRSLLSLDQIGERQEVVVVHISGDDRAATRLKELGFISEAKVKVVRNTSSAILIDISGARIALGRDLAVVIKVRRG